MDDFHLTLTASIPDKTTPGHPRTTIEESTAVIRDWLTQNAGATYAQLVVVVREGRLLIMNLDGNVFDLAPTPLKPEVVDP